MTNINEQPDEKPLSHGMNCAGNIPYNDSECTCGLRWRIMLQTEQTMHNAWRKRAEESEAELLSLKRRNTEPHDSRKMFEHWAQAHKHHFMSEWKDGQCVDYTKSELAWAAWQSALSEWGPRSPAERESVAVEDIDAEIAIAEGIQLIPEKYIYEQFGTPVLRHLKSLVYRIVKVDEQGRRG